MRYKTDILMTESRYWLGQLPEKSNMWRGNTFEDEEKYALLESGDSKILLPYNLSTKFGETDELVTTMMFPRDVIGFNLTRLSDRIVKFPRVINGFELTARDDETTILFGRGSFNSCELVDDVSASDDIERYVINRLINFTVNPIIRAHVKTKLEQLNRLK